MGPRAGELGRYGLVLLQYLGASPAYPCARSHSNNEVSTAVLRPKESPNRPLVDESATYGNYGEFSSLSLSRHPESSDRGALRSLPWGHDHFLRGKNYRKRRDAVLICLHAIEVASRSTWPAITCVSSLVTLLACPCLDITIRRLHGSGSIFYVRLKLYFLEDR
ncbi:hypothetical protein FB45DRAFT_6008 [Roridomyces roridus]|uniref:Uncharacterized protein n=1 Tax=Roridomyces roridus TaxID=1738132 RepID=A0AAD7CIC7_9AGAR|nr:hypothetical protein FB45DRAFT_6008 [Roridomyces roridus]